MSFFQGALENHTGFQTYAVGAKDFVVDLRILQWVPELIDRSRTGVGKLLSVKGQIVFTVF